MSGLPRMAHHLLHAFGVDAALIGDLDESARSGRSSLWCWYQVAGALCLSSWRVGVTRPGLAVRGIAVGWCTLLATFLVIDSPAINRLRLDAYRTGEWTTFWLVAGALSYVGFALSAWVVARVHRRAPGLLVLYTSTVVLGLVASAMLPVLKPEPMPLPHVLFPLVSVALPYQWRSGLILAPAVMLLAGMVAFRRHRPFSV